MVMSSLFRYTLNSKEGVVEMASTHRMFALLLAVVLILTNIRSLNGCPTICTCNATTVNCESKSLISVPSGIPSTVVSVYLHLNHITTIDTGSFQDLADVKRLRLDQNKITTITPKAFRELKSLEELDLSSNKIHILEVSVFDVLTSLTKLDLLNNTVVCNCDLRPFKAWLTERNLGSANIQCGGTYLAEYTLPDCADESDFIVYGVPVTIGSIVLLSGICLCFVLIMQLRKGKPEKHSSERRYLTSMNGSRRAMMMNVLDPVSEGITTDSRSEDNIKLSGYGNKEYNGTEMVLYNDRVSNHIMENRSNMMYGSTENENENIKGFDFDYVNYRSNIPSYTMTLFDEYTETKIPRLRVATISNINLLPEYQLSRTDDILVQKSIKFQESTQLSTYQTEGMDVVLLSKGDDTSSDSNDSVANMIDDPARISAVDYEEQLVVVQIRTNEEPTDDSVNVMNVSMTNKAGQTSPVHIDEGYSSTLMDRSHKLSLEKTHQRRFLMEAKSAQTIAEQSVQTIAEKSIQTENIIEETKRTEESMMNGTTDVSYMFEPLKSCETQTDEETHMSVRQSELLRKDESYFVNKDLIEASATVTCSGIYRDQFAEMVAVKQSVIPESDCPVIVDFVSTGECESLVKHESGDVSENKADVTNETQQKYDGPVIVDYVSNRTSESLMLESPIVTTYEVDECNTKQSDPDSTIVVENRPFVN